jgi:hypothetical protein
MKSEVGSLRSDEVRTSIRRCLYFQTSDFRPQTSSQIGKFAPTQPHDDYENGELES